MPRYIKIGGDTVFDIYTLKNYLNNENAGFEIINRSTTIFTLKDAKKTSI
ncbi:hypothetical protein [Anaerosphaera multitolerans]|nr:hypothetical protein [Anaerosphaera multitolerans]